MLISNRTLQFFEISAKNTQLSQFWSQIQEFFFFFLKHILCLKKFKDANDTAVQGLFRVSAQKHLNEIILVLLLIFFARNITF